MSVGIFQKYLRFLKFLIAIRNKIRKIGFMKLEIRLASLVVVLATASPLMSATESERLRALCREQEMQIRQLEEKIARLTDSPPPSRATPSVGFAGRDFQPVSAETTTYTVKSGDSIERIARTQGTTAATLKKINGLESNSIIHPEQKLIIPSRTAVTFQPPAPSRESRTHTVVKGETFYRISIKYGVSVDELIAANPGVNHKTLNVGKKIRVDYTTPAVAKSNTTSSLASASPHPIINHTAPAPLVEKPRAHDRPVRIEKEITYGQFAAANDTTTRRLDELNGLELDPSTVLAQGSELYIPAQP